MKIGVDIDDTIADSYESFYSWALEYDKKLRGTGRITNNRNYHSDFDWTKDEINEFYFQYFLKIFTGIKPKSEAVEILKKLHRDGHEIIFITSRNSMNTQNNAYDITVEWMNKYNIPYDKIITESKDKGIICKEEQIDVFIDDILQQCISVTQNNEILVFLYDDYNRYGKYDGIIKAENWNEIYEYIKNR